MQLGIGGKMSFCLYLWLIIKFVYTVLYHENCLASPQ